MISTKSFTKLRYYSYGLIFILAVYFRFSGELVTLLDNDAAGYVEPALNYLQNNRFTHNNSRSYPYPLFTLGVLSIFKNINSICLLQHAFSIITLLFTILYFEKHVLKNKPHKLIFCAFVTFLILCFLNGNLIFFEKVLRPEGLLLPSLFFTFYLIHRLSLNYKEHALSINLVVFSIFFFLLFAYLMPRSSISFYFISLFIYLITLKKEKWTFKALLVFHLKIVVVSFIILFPEKQLVKKYEPLSSEFAYRHFFFSNLFVVEKAIKNGDYIEKEYDLKVMKRIIEQTLHQNNKDESTILKYDLDFAQYQLFKHAPSKNYFKNWFTLLIKEYPIEVAHKTYLQLENLIFNPKVLF